MSKVKKEFKLVARVKNCPEVFIEGEEAGVVSTMEVTYTQTEEAFDSVLFKAHLLEQSDEFLKDAFEANIYDEEGKKIL